MAKKERQIGESGPILVLEGCFTCSSRPKRRALGLVEDAPRCLVPKCLPRHLAFIVLASTARSHAALRDAL